MNFTDGVTQRFMAFWRGSIAGQYDRIEKSQDLYAFINNERNSNLPCYQIRRYLSDHWSQLFETVPRPDNDWMDWSDDELIDVVNICTYLLGGKKDLWRKYLYYDGPLRFGRPAKKNILEISLRLGITKNSDISRFLDSIDGTGLNSRNYSEIIFLYVCKKYHLTYGKERFSIYKKLVDLYETKNANVLKDPTVSLSTLEPGYTSLGEDLALIDHETDDQFIDELSKYSSQMHGYSITNAVKELRLYQYLSLILCSKDTIYTYKQTSTPDHPYITRLNGLLDTFSNNASDPMPIDFDEYGYPKKNRQVMTKIMLGLDTGDIMCFNRQRPTTRFLFGVAQILEDVSNSISNKKAIVTGKSEYSPNKDLDYIFQNNLKNAETTKSEIVLICFLVFMLSSGKEDWCDLPKRQNNVVLGDTLRKIDELKIIDSFDTNVQKAIRYALNARAELEILYKNNDIADQNKLKTILEQYILAFNTVLDEFIGFHQMYIPNAMDSYVLQCLISNHPEDLYIETIYPEIDFSDISFDEKRGHKKRAFDYDEDEYKYTLDNYSECDIETNDYISSHSEKLNDTLMMIVDVQMGNRVQEDKTILDELYSEEKHTKSISWHRLNDLINDTTSIEWTMTVLLRMGFSFTEISKNYSWINDLEGLLKDDHVKAVLYAIDSRLAKKIFSGMMMQFDYHDIISSIDDNKLIKYEDFLSLFSGRSKSINSLTDKHYWAYILLLHLGYRIDIDNSSLKIPNSLLRIHGTYCMDSSLFIPDYRQDPNEILLKKEEQLSKLVGNHIGFLKARAENYCYGDTRNIKDDLIQEAYLGFSKAINKFDISRNTQLLTYAYDWINKYILDYISNNASLLNYNKFDNINDYDDMHDTEYKKGTYDLNGINLSFSAIKYLNTTDQFLINRYNEGISIKEISSELNYSEERILYMLRKAYSHLFEYIITPPKEALGYRYTS